MYSIYKKTEEGFVKIKNSTVKEFKEWLEEDKLGIKESEKSMFLIKSQDHFIFFNLLNNK